MVGTNPVGVRWTGSSLVIIIIIITKVTDLEKTLLLEKKTVISYSLLTKYNSIEAIN